MEEWLKWLFIGLCGLTAITGLACFVKLMPKPTGGQKVLILGVIVGFASAGAFFAAVLTSSCMTESDALMDRLGREDRDFVVVSVSSEDDEICGVLAGDDDVVCITPDKVWNYGEHKFDAPAVAPATGNLFSVLKITAYGEEGVRFLDP